MQRVFADVLNDLGTPPAWTPLREPRKLEEDKGDYLRDRNAARFPSYPLEPAVRALLKEHEDLDTQNVDLFACSSTLGNLLRFVRRVDKSFRFFVEVVGNTVFFTRHENSPTELIVGVKGYGHTFPETYTTWDTDVRGSASHQRLLRYNFAGLDCVLRFECDGYIKNKVPGGFDAPATVPNQQVVVGVNELASALEPIKTSSPLSGKGKHEAPLRIETSGQKIPQEAVFDLKTRSSWRKDLNVLEDEIPSYWVAQIPHFILARHKGGVFDDIKVQDIRNNVQEWQTKNQKVLGRLNWLLREIITAAKARKDGKLEVCCKGKSALEFREQDKDESGVLPLQLKLRWMEGGSSESKEHKSDGKSTTDAASPFHGSDINNDGNVEIESDDESEKDYTACSADSCGYCGHCSY